MSIVSVTEALDFIGITEGYFEITTVNNSLNLTSNKGGPVDIDIAGGNYSGSELATELQTRMNANTTLTGAVISFSVSYSATTRKFAIDAGTSNTIAYDHSESDGGLTLGFNEDASASQTIASNNAAGDPAAIVETIRDAVEDYVQGTFCKRVFESTAYTLERYDGSGKQIINIDNFPLISVDRIAIGTLNVIKVKNTADYTTASVSVTSTGIRLVKDGTADETVLFSAYTTMATVVAAINAIGSGWQADMMSTSYDSYKSTELLDQWGRSAIKDNWIYLEMPDEAEDDFEVHPGRGWIRKLSGFPSGFRNVIVDYTAGYASASMPEDLKLGIKILIQYFYQKMKEETYGISSFNTGKLATSFQNDKDIPKEAIALLGRFKRKKV